MIFKLYVLSTYPNPTHKLNPHRKHSAVLIFFKYLILEDFPQEEQNIYPHKVQMTGIAILKGTFGLHNVTNNRSTLTHTQKHMLSFYVLCSFPIDVIIS